MEYQQDLWGTRPVRVLHRTAVFHFQARSGIRRQGNEEPVADPDCQRKGDQSTESKRWLLYAVRQLPDGQNCLHSAYGHGSLPVVKAGGCVCDRVGTLHCSAADHKRERDARKSAGTAPADAAAALPITQHRKIRYSHAGKEAEAPLLFLFRRKRKDGFYEYCRDTKHGYPGAHYHPCRYPQRNRHPQRQHPGDCHGRDNNPHPEVYAPEYRFQRTPGFPGASL